MEEVKYETEVRNHLCKRILWIIVWTLFVRPFPRNMASSWEVFLLRLFGAKIGKGAMIYSSAFIWLPEHIVAGDNIQIADHVRIQNSKPLYIKDGATISQYSYICDGNHYVENLEEGFAESITLEENSWIGAECYVACGATIGRGCMVGARTVVRNNLPPYSIVNGNPCKVVGFRFTPKEIVAKEINEFSEEERIPFDTLHRNYEKYFLKRIKDIKEFTRL